MAVKPVPRQARVEFGPLAARPNAQTLPDWFIYVADEGGISRVLNGAWVTLGGDPAMEGVHIVGAAGEPAFQNGWASYAGFGPVGFWKMGDLVFMQGLAQATLDPVANSVIWTMPAAYRPTLPRYIQASTNTPSTTFVFVETDGDVCVAANLAVSGAVYFDGLFYRI